MADIGNERVLNENVYMYVPTRREHDDEDLESSINALAEMNMHGI